MWRTRSVWLAISPWSDHRLGRHLGLVVAAVVLGALAAAPASAIQINSDHVVVPVIVHTTGYNSTMWRTDVWVTNAGGDAGDLTLSYYPAAGGELTQSMSIAAYGGHFFPDIVLQTFSLDDSKGMLIVSSASTYVEVRARVYNTGDPAGQFGQAVPGLPLGRLSSQGYISGVSTAVGNRLSVGIANPTDRAFDVRMSVSDPVTGEQFSGETVTLSPHQLVQLDKVAERWNLPERDDLAIVVDIVNTEPADGIYAYASVVRNDTGDATFLFGTTPNAGHQ